MALVKEYFKLTEKYTAEYGEKTILLYQVGAFFEIYGLKKEKCESQIVEFAKICDLNIADKNMNIDGYIVLLAGFSHYMLDKYLKRLQEEGYTSIVYTQTEQDKTVRELYGIFSPGTSFIEDTNKITNHILCIWVEVGYSLFLKKKQLTIGMSNLDIYTGECTIFEYQTEHIKNPTQYDELERFVSIYNPSEVILITNLEETDAEDIMSYAHIQCKSVHTILLDNNNNNNNNKMTTGRSISTNQQKAIHCQKQTYQTEILKKYYHIDHLSLQFFEYAMATQSFCFLLDFVHQHNPNLVKHIKEPTFENCTERMILANHSLKQLNILSDGGGIGGTGKYSCVEKMLNVCITSLGKRRFMHHLLNPTTNTDYLQSEYDTTEHVLTQYDKYEELGLKTHLLSIKDISKMQRQSIVKRITPKSLGQFYKNLFSIQQINSFFKEDVSMQKYFLNKITGYAKLDIFCGELIAFLETHFLVEECLLIDSFSSYDTNFIRQGVDSELDEKTRLSENATNQLEDIKETLNQILCKYESKKKNSADATEYVKLHETEKNNMSLISTKRRCELLKKSAPATLHLAFHHQSASNDCITSPEISELCRTISTMKIMLKDIVGKVFIRLIEKLQQYQQQIDCVIEFITMVDLIYAKATIAKKMNYCKPSIIDTKKSFVDAKNLRHCLIENIQQHELYVGNDIVLGKNQNGILLYGVNMVGKTSLIKSIGVAVIMAQAGLYVPASQFEYYPYKYIFTRILNNDNLFKGLSTFAVEMSELRTILKMADDSSLILGDEIAAGSESSSAISIFVAALRNLYSKQSSFIFATHMHEIAGFEEIKDMLHGSLKMKHMEVAYDREKDMLIYNRKLKDGSGARNYGLEVAKYLKLPADFLEDANQIRLKYFEQGQAGHDGQGILSLKTSHFNNKKVVGMCEMCHLDMGIEVHHLQHQHIANKDGIIKKEEEGLIFHKNHVANLMSLCKKCHDQFHEEELITTPQTKETKTKETKATETKEESTKKKVKMHKKVKTTKDMCLKEL